MSIITIPPQYYVGVAPTFDKDSLPTGFATPDGTDAAAKKRKETVNRWVSGCRKGTPNQSIVLENIPRQGFAVSRSIRRSGSWNSNVVWRIEDPAGFELEISSGNFAEILSQTTIVNGAIQGNCIWAREGSNNILLPENSERYNEAINFTKLSSQQISAKNLKPGVVLVGKNAVEYVYIGVLYLATIKTPFNKEFHYEVKKRHAFIPREHYDDNYDVTKIELRADIKFFKDVVVQLPCPNGVDYIVKTVHDTFATNQNIEKEMSWWLYTLDGNNNGTPIAMSESPALMDCSLKITDATQLELTGKLPFSPNWLWPALKMGGSNYVCTSPKWETVSHGSHGSNQIFKAGDEIKRGRNSLPDKSFVRNQPLTNQLCVYIEDLNRTWFIRNPFHF